MWFAILIRMIRIALYYSWLRRPKKLSEYKPQIPTIAKTTLEKTVALPKRVLTRSKLRNPMSPQFIAPIITKMTAL